MSTFPLSTFDTVATIGSVSNYKPVGPIAETNFGKVGKKVAPGAMDGPIAPIALLVTTD